MTKHDYPDLDNVDACYAYCRKVTHKHGPNFSVGFRFLPSDKRRAVYATYAFCRFADDMADEVGTGDPEQLLDRWAGALDRCYADTVDHPILAALSDAIHRFDIPREPFHRLIDGCRMDLVKTRYETFDELLIYCDHVASTISELSLAIFGWSDPCTPEWGRNLSTALQLTNIIRDVSEDYRRGRVYIPQEDLRTFKCTDAVFGGEGDPERFRHLMDFQVERALGYFARARSIVGAVEPDSRLAVALMGGVYHRIAAKIGRDVSAVLRRRVVLSNREKLQLMMSLSYRTILHRAGIAPAPAW